MDVYEHLRKSNLENYLGSIPFVVELYGHEGKYLKYIQDIIKKPDDSRRKIIEICSQTVIIESVSNQFDPYEYNNLLFKLSREYLEEGLDIDVCEVIDHFIMNILGFFIYETKVTKIQLPYFIEDSFKLMSFMLAEFILKEYGKK